MVRLNFGLKNPFKYENFISFYNWSGKISKNKRWEIQLYHYAYEWLYFNMDLSWTGQDHAGPNIEFGIFGYNINFKIYDVRHWDYDLQKWMTYDT